MSVGKPENGKVSWAVTQSPFPLSHGFPVMVGEGVRNFGPVRGFKVKKIPLEILMRTRLESGPKYPLPHRTGI